MLKQRKHQCHSKQKETIKFQELRYTPKYWKMSRTACGVVHIGVCYMGGGGLGIKCYIGFTCSPSRLGSRH
eukprot:5783270-Amphidinium_carterae.1